MSLVSLDASGSGPHLCGFVCTTTSAHLKPGRRDCVTCSRQAGATNPLLASLRRAGSKRALDLPLVGRAEFTGSDSEKLASTSGGTKVGGARSLHLTSLEQFLTYKGIRTTADENPAVFRLMSKVIASAKATSHGCIMSITVLLRS